MIRNTPTIAAKAASPVVSSAALRLCGSVTSATTATGTAKSVLESMAPFLKIDFGLKTARRPMTVKV